MGEGYESVPNAESWQDLDEFLCEYVDGTMDPVVRKVFEEYVRENPELAEHVQCLCEAREALVHSVCVCQLKADFLDRLRRRLSQESARSERVFPEMVSQLGYLAAFTSALVVMTVAAILVVEYAGSEEAIPESEEYVARHIEDFRFSDVFVPPRDLALQVNSLQRMTPIPPRRMPIVPLWADADWRRGGAAVAQVSAAW